MIRWFKNENKEIDLMMLPFRRRIAPEYAKYASFNRRMMAATIDSLLLLLLSPIFDWLAPINHSGITNVQLQQNDPALATTLIQTMLSDSVFVTSWLNNFKLQMAFCLVYSFICWIFFQGTLGKRILQMKIVDSRTDGKPNLMQWLLRISGYVISGSCLMLGFLWMGMNKRKRAWHDYLADTAVIVEPFDWKKITDRLPALAPKPPEPEKNDETPAD